MFRTDPLYAAGIACVFVLTAVVGSASAADITGIRILTATERDAGFATNHFYDVLVKGDGISNCAFRDLSTEAWYEMSYDPSQDGWHYQDAHYPSIGDLFAAHPDPANLLFYFNREPSGAFGDAVLISNWRPFPTDYDHVTYPLPDESVPVDPVILWDFGGEAERSGTALLNLDTGETVAVAYSPDSSPRSWAPGPLDPDTHYAVVLGVWNVVTGDPIYLQTLFGDSFTFIGIMNDSNLVRFTTESGPPTDIPEPATMALVATGLAAGGWVMRRRCRKPGSAER